MDKKEIFLQTESSPNLNRLKRKCLTTIPNLKYKRKKKPTLNYSKLKFKQNVLLNILRKSNLRKNKKKSHIQQSELISNNQLKRSIPNPNNNLLYKLNKKYIDILGISKYHNVTDETINDLIKSKDDTNNEIKKTNENTYSSLQSYNITRISGKFSHQNTFNLFFNKANINSQNNFNNRYERNKEMIYKVKNDFSRNSINSKKFKLNKNELSSNSNFTNSIPNLKIKNQQLFSNTNSKSNSISNNNNTKKGKSLCDTISSNLKRIKFSKLGKINSPSETKKWLESIKDSIKHFDFLHRNSKADRLRFYLENPDECFEDNVLDEKPGDKYQLFKNQIMKHKAKFDTIIKDIKLNQIKSEYLMRRYIFDLLSRKKKIY